MPYRFWYFFLCKRHAINQTLVFGIAAGQMFRFSVLPSQRAPKLGVFTLYVWGDCGEGGLLRDARTVFPPWRRPHLPGDGLRLVVPHTTFLSDPVNFCSNTTVPSTAGGRGPVPGGLPPGGKHRARCSRGPCRCVPIVSFCSAPVLLVPGPLRLSPVSPRS